MLGHCARKLRQVVSGAGGAHRLAHTGAGRQRNTVLGEHHLSGDPGLAPEPASQQPVQLIQGDAGLRDLDPAVRRPGIRQRNRLKIVGLGVQAGDLVQHFCGDHRAGHSTVGQRGGRCKRLNDQPVGLACAPDHDGERGGRRQHAGDQQRPQRQGHPLTGDLPSDQLVLADEQLVRGSDGRGSRRLGLHGDLDGVGRGRRRLGFQPCPLRAVARYARHLRPHAP